MIRTQVYLPKDLYQEIKIVASQEKKASAQIIRDLLKEGVHKKRATGKTGGQALLELAALGKKLGLKGPKDFSTNIDKYLYEDA